MQQRKTAIEMLIEGVPPEEIVEQLHLTEREVSIVYRSLMEAE